MQDLSYSGLQWDEVQSVSLDLRLLREVGDICTSLTQPYHQQDPIKNLLRLQQLSISADIVDKSKDIS